MYLSAKQPVSEIKCYDISYSFTPEIRRDTRNFIHQFRDEEHSTPNCLLMRHSCFTLSNNQSSHFKVLATTHIETVHMWIAKVQWQRSNGV